MPLQFKFSPRALFGFLRGLIRDNTSANRSDPNRDLGGGSSDVRPGLYRRAIIINYLVLLVAAIVMYKVWYLVLIIAVLQFLVAWGVAHEEEVVILTLFALPVKELELGPFFSIWPMRPRRFPSVPQQFQFPDEPERVFMGDDKLPLPPGMMRAFRVMSGGPSKDYEGPLNIQMAATMTGTVRWGIVHPMAFLRQLAGSTVKEKIEEARRQMYDTWANAIGKEVQCRPIGLVVDLMATTITDNVRADLEKATESWGIRIFEVTIRSPNLGHDLSGKLAGIGEAKAEAEALNLRTTAQANNVREIGQANADAALAKRKAEVDGDAYEAEKLGVDGRDVFAAQVARDVFGPKDKFIFGLSGVTDAMAGAAAAAVNSYGKNNQKGGAKTDA